MLLGNAIPLPTTCSGPSSIGTSFYGMTIAHTGLRFPQKDHRMPLLGPFTVMGRPCSDLRKATIVSLLETIAGVEAIKPTDISALSGNEFRAEPIAHDPWPCPTSTDEKPICEEDIWRRKTCFLLFVDWV